jgi:hypothetical protein
MKQRETKGSFAKDCVPLTCRHGCRYQTTDAPSKRERRGGVFLPQSDLRLWPSRALMKASLDDERNSGKMDVNLVNFALGENMNPAALKRW